MEIAPSEQVVDSRRDFALILATGVLALISGIAALRVLDREQLSLDLGLTLMALEVVLAAVAMTRAFTRRARLGVWGPILGVLFGLVGLAGVGYFGLLGMMFFVGARVGG